MNQLLAAAVALANMPDTSALAKAEAAVRAVLKDPQAAQFSNLQVRKNLHGQARICGQVNAKNSFGAFTGFEWFIYDPRYENVQLESSIDDPETWNMIFVNNCR